MGTRLIQFVRPVVRAILKAVGVGVAAIAFVVVFALSGAAQGVGNFLELRLNGNRVVMSGAGTAVVTIPANTATIITDAGTNTFTNKTINAEGTGNIITLPFTKSWPATICFAAASPGYEDSGWSHIATGVGAGPDVAPCSVGSNTLFGSTAFENVGAEYYHNKFWLPSDWTGAIDFRIAWNTTATTGNVVWQIQTACSAASETIDPSWNTASTVTQAAQGTTTRLAIASITGATTTGCAAGEMMFIRFLRDSGHASDTLAASANLIELEMTYRRAM